MITAGSFRTETCQLDPVEEPVHGQASGQITAPYLVNADPVSKRILRLHTVLGNQIATLVDKAAPATKVADMEGLQIASIAADTSDPGAGLRAVASLRVLTDTLELQQVEAALRSGMSWQCIAEALGVTRQAVHKKFAKRIDQNIPVPRRSR